MIRYLKLWWVFARQSVKRDLIYRGDFFLESMYWLINVFLMILNWNIIFGHTHQINGWTKDMMLSLYGLGIMLMSISSMLLSRNVFGFRWVIHHGGFDRMLTYPVSSLFTSMFRYVELATIVRFVAGLVLFTTSVQGVRLSVGSLAVFLLLAGAGVVFIMLLHLLVASMGFWSVEMPLSAFYQRIAGTFVHYPVRIFSKSWQHVLTWILPMAF